MDPKEIIGELLRMARRRLPVVLPILVLGVAAAVTVAARKPSVYEASTKILVEGPRISDVLARSTVNQTAAARLQLIEERLMARDNLEDVVDRMALFEAPGLAKAARADLLRQSTVIQSISISTGASNPWAVNTGAGIFGFTITVTLDDPRKAAEIANEFAAEAVSQNVAVRSDQARDTLAYFQAEDQRIAAEVAAKEAQIAAFKTDHDDALPESLEARRQTESRLRENMLEVDRRIMELEEKLADLDAAAAGERPLDGAAGADPSETRLRELELDLSRKQGTLAPNHPEVRRLRDEIAAVKAMLAPRAGAPGPRNTAASDRRTAIERQSAQVSSQIAQLRAQSSEMASQSAALEAAMRQTPRIAIELDTLTRDLTEMRAMRTDVARRYAEAQTGADLEASQRSERFQVVEAAQVPDIPVGPDRKKIVALGAIGSIAVAVGFAFLLEFMNPVLRGSAQMERSLGIRPVVAIPYVYRPGERLRRRLRWVAACLLVALGIGLAVPVLSRNVTPIGPAIERLAGAAGLGGLFAPRL